MESKIQKLEAKVATLEGLTQTVTAAQRRLIDKVQGAETVLTGQGFDRKQETFSNIASGIEEGTLPPDSVQVHEIGDLGHNVYKS